MEHNGPRASPACIQESVMTEVAVGTPALSVNLRRRMDSNFVRWLCSESMARSFLVEELSRLDSFAAEDLLRAATTLQQVASVLDSNVATIPVELLGEQLFGGEGSDMTDIVMAEGTLTAPSLLSTLVKVNVEDCDVIKSTSPLPHENIPYPDDHYLQLDLASNKHTIPPLSPRRAKRSVAGNIVTVENDITLGPTILTDNIAMQSDTGSTITQCLTPEDELQPIEARISSISMQNSSSESNTFESDKEKGGPHVWKKDSGIDLNSDEPMEIAKPPHPIDNFRFYFPLGHPDKKERFAIKGCIDENVCKFFEPKRPLDQMLVSALTSSIRSAFASEGNAEELRELGKLELWPVMDACQLPRYLSFAVFQRVDQGRGSSTVNHEDFTAWWKDLNKTYHDDFALLFRILCPEGKRHLVPEDFNIVIEEIVQRHPGLEFLSAMPVFQARYVETVTTRIFYDKRQNWTEKMTLPELRKHSFLTCLRNVQIEDDINATRDFFSYKHFYVIYCKFWELDSDHDMLIQGEDLNRYDRNALTSLIIKRILSGSARKLSSGDEGKLSYKDFIWFLLSVEDKRSVGSVEYWFRCLDLDGDGVISLHELRDFYNEQFDRMLEFRMSDPWKFEDFVCSLLDLIKPQRDSQIMLSDLKKSSNASLFFDMIFDIRKYDMHIRRIDPTFREIDDVWVEERGKRVKLEGWDKFAERTYDELAMEERRSQSSCRSYDYSSYDVEDLEEDWGDDDGEPLGWSTMNDKSFGERTSGLGSTDNDSGNAMDIVTGDDEHTGSSSLLRTTAILRTGSFHGTELEDDDDWEDEEEESDLNLKASGRSADSNMDVEEGSNKNEP
ncbi:Serine/threonine-protein phosphatase 2A regulatory subunit B'' subunit beta [Phlyctochytrium planicorne]|nr:Serine/threonine-protein phosphatase 2A regulatory subunit B'' subunit beta [Phlyctochytrium planicorne]